MDEIDELYQGEDKPLGDVPLGDEWGRSYYGVRMEYPLTEHVMASVSCNEYRTTEENYRACITRLVEYLKFRPRHNQVHMSFFRSRAA